MKFTHQLILAFLAVVFLMKGGFGIIAAAWKLVIPLVLLGGAYFLMKKALASGINLGKGVSSNPEQVKTARADNADIIEICPHCLAEVGSCPKCKKNKFF